MIDFNERLVDILEEAVGEIPVYYEYFTEKTDIPSVSYYESSNNALADGDTLRYSDITYFIKIWSYKVSELNSIALAIDSKLKEYGLKRISSGDGIEDNNLLVKYMGFRATGYEKI